MSTRPSDATYPGTMGVPLAADEDRADQPLRHALDHTSVAHEGRHLHRAVTSFRPLNPRRAGRPGGRASGSAGGVRVTPVSTSPGNFTNGGSGRVRIGCEARHPLVTGSVPRRVGDSVPRDKFVLPRVHWASPIPLAAEWRVKSERVVGRRQMHPEKSLSSGRPGHYFPVFEKSCSCDINDQGRRSGLRPAEFPASTGRGSGVADTMNPSWRREGRDRAGASSFHRAKAGADTNQALRLTWDLDR